jgi:hypothetical protein
MLVLLVSDYTSKGDARCSGHVSFYHESGRVSFYNKSGRVSYSVYREMSVRMVCLCFISPLKSTLSARAEQWWCPILPYSYHFFPFLDALSKNLVVMKHNSYKGLSSPPYSCCFCPLYHATMILIIIRT